MRADFGKRFTVRRMDLQHAGAERKIELVFRIGDDGWLSVTMSLEEAKEFGEKFVEMAALP